MSAYNMENGQKILSVGAVGFELGDVGFALGAVLGAVVNKK